MTNLLRQSYKNVAFLMTFMLLVGAGSVQAQDVLNTNGSFEATDLGAVEDPENGVEGWLLNPGDGLADFEVVEDPVQDGSRALEVAVNEAGDNAFSIEAVATDIPVVPDSTYEYSVWARAESEGAVASFTVGNYDFEEYGRAHQVELGTEWQEITLEFTIDDEADSIRAPIHFSYEANVDNSIYVDNLSIEGPAPEPEEPNLVTNGSFESFEVGAVTELEGWFINGTDLADFEIVDDPVQDGDRALGVTVNEAGDNSWNIEATAIDVPVIPDSTYEYSVWARTASGEATANFTVGGLESEGFPEYGRLHQETVTSEWQEFTLTFSTPEADRDTVRAPIHFSFEGNEGSTIYIDDLHIEGPEPEPEPDPNLVTNGSFESSEAGAVTELEGWLLSGTDLADFEVVEDPVQDGSRALEVAVNETGSDAFSIEAVATDIPVVPDSTYEYSVWARAESEGAVASFTVGNYDFEEYGRAHQVELGTEWQEITLEFTIDDEADSIRAPIHFSYEANVDNSIYIDNLTIQLEQEDVATDPVDGRAQFALKQNYPNPFNPTTTIEYQLDTPTDVTLSVYNVLGQRVATLVDETQTAGSHKVRFEAEGLSSGVYFYRIKAGDNTESRRMVLVE